MRLDKRGRVRGIRGTDVEDVLRAYREVASAGYGSAAVPKSPWRTGSFYLTLFVVVIGALYLVGHFLPAWVVPLVVVGCLFMVPVVGALQLRQDDRLSERGFVRLITATITKLPASLGQRRVDPEFPADETSMPS